MLVNILLAYSRNGCESIGKRKTIFSPWSNMERMSASSDKSVISSRFLEASGDSLPDTRLKEECRDNYLWSSDVTVWISYCKRTVSQDCYETTTVYSKLKFLIRVRRLLTVKETVSWEFSVRRQLPRPCTLDKVYKRVSRASFVFFAYYFFAYAAWNRTELN